MKSLKDKLRSLPPRPAAKPVAAAPAPEPDLDFQRQMRDVTPMPADDRVHFVPPRPSPHPKKRPQGMPDARHPQHVGWFEPADNLNHFVRAGMQAATLRKLRAFHWPVCAELDLHGLDRYQAQDRLTVFLHRARRIGQCVRIIHGRGIGSHGEPILKRMTRTWLTHHPDVLAWSDSNDGGALLVLLRTMTD
ncbi:Smr/MutS family protein [Paludibacterium purpuratum]|uniref:DNA-nicking Smr family endonuclease n=1 Tax=Paludibacterium purpuratum TaxID=1144873 RepID=A0A4V3DVT4_9NEIS|nr:Smr/MutS family protein [Paludibacterium purpuratum]TDR81999.1 DNA-nicking Smr family endonuclease [Paludibacterium purpuratum]